MITSEEIPPFSKRSERVQNELHGFFIFSLLFLFFFFFLKKKYKSLPTGRWKKEEGNWELMDYRKVKGKGKEKKKGGLGSNFSLDG